MCCIIHLAMRDLKTLRTQKNPQHKFPQEASGTYSKLEFQALSVVVFFFFFMHCSIINGRNKITLNMSSFIIFNILKLVGSLFGVQTQYDWDTSPMSLIQ